MSLLESIQKARPKLNKCSTTVTKLSGEKFTESIDESGSVQQIKLSERRAGFIEDLKPDLQVAEILPYLTLGSQDVVADLATLRSHSITHVLSVGVRLQQKYEGITYKFVGLYDLPEANLLAVLPETNAFIDLVKSSSGKVFVHCNAGCSRAPSVVIGYLISSQNLTYREAFLYVGDKRYVRPNEGFTHQLIQLQKSLNLETGK